MAGNRRAALTAAEAVGAPAATTGSGPAREVTVALPGVWRLGLAQGGVEVKAFFRDKMAVAFIFGLPSILLVLLGSIFGSQAAARGVTVGQLFTAGMIAGGIMSTSFQYLAIGIATERENGMLKRLHGTPMPPAAYFMGKVVQVLVCTVAETVLLMAVGIAFYHLHLPTSPGRWWTFAWVFVLGSAACSLLGIAASSLPRSAASATPVITLPFTVLQFISGVYVPFNDVPGWMRDVASFFPLKWMAQGMRSVFLPGRAAALEPARAWEHGRTALVLAIWIAAGLVLCAKTFRWQSRR
jgi:ABC-2 type transport system permease protein